MLVRSASFAAAIQVSLVFYALVAGQGSLDQLFFAVGIAHSPQAPISSFLLVALMVFALIVRVSSNNLDVWSTEDEMDAFARRHSSAHLLILMVVGFFVAPYLVLGSRDYWIVPALLLVLTSKIVFGPIYYYPRDLAAVAREVVKDEFYRAMRARASKLGFAVVMLAGSVALLLLHNNLAQGQTILFAVLYAGVAGSMLYYDYLIWRADRGN